MKNNKSFLILFIAVMLLIFTTGCGKQADEEPKEMMEQTEEMPAEEETIEVQESVMPEAVEEEVTSEGEVIQMKEQTNVDILEEFILYNPGAVMPKEKTEGESWFSGLSCQHAELAEGEKSQEKLDKFSFSITNKADEEFVLRYVKYSEPDFEKPNMRIQINGRRIRDVETACGKDVIKPGETIFCQNADAYLKEGESFTGKTLTNSITAETTYYTTKVMFTC